MTLSVVDENNLTDDIKKDSGFRALDLELSKVTGMQLGPVYGSEFIDVIITAMQDAGWEIKREECKKKKCPTCNGRGKPYVHDTESVCLTCGGSKEVKAKLDRIESEDADPLIGYESRDARKVVAEIIAEEDEVAADSGGSLKDFPLAGTICEVCLDLQFDTPSGLVCMNGHGGVAPFRCPMCEEYPDHKPTRDNPCKCGGSFLPDGPPGPNDPDYPDMMEEGDK